MKRANIPTADFEVFTLPAPARAWAKERGGKVAVKADGLARGKGVIVCANVAEADAAINAMLVENRFGRSGPRLWSRSCWRDLSFRSSASLMALTFWRLRRLAITSAPMMKTPGRIRRHGAYSPPLGVDDALVKEVVDTVLRPAVLELAASGDEFRVFCMPDSC